eukprot:TRINITY_DN22090_c0_g1_i1.p1 TRINITY_DN22090_c0_g1~~TRINITY_DN22090_c0_g1_i1.p1  ORF type:complete len:220 (+),score=8.97 TRINITY_DN22090_c0_g1_i1:28-660(+)
MSILPSVLVRCRRHVLRTRCAGSTLPMLRAGSTRSFHQGPPGSRPPPAPKTIDGIQHIIGVSSAKGGVGKSTTAGKKSFDQVPHPLQTIVNPGHKLMVLPQPLLPSLPFPYFRIVNLALGLKALGLQVGLLDGDIYGPSIPRLMNIQDKPLINAEEKMIPLESYGIKCMSMGFLMDSDSAAIWRGPMVMAASEQLLHQEDPSHIYVAIAH